MCQAFFSIFLFFPDLVFSPDCVALPTQLFNSGKKRPADGFRAATAESIANRTRILAEGCKTAANRVELFVLNCYRHSQT